MGADLKSHMTQLAFRRLELASCLKPLVFFWTWAAFVPEFNVMSTMLCAWTLRVQLCAATSDAKGKDKCVGHRRPTHLSLPAEQTAEDLYRKPFNFYCIEVKAELWETRLNDSRAVCLARRKESSHRTAHQTSDEILDKRSMTNDLSRLMSHPFLAPNPSTSHCSWHWEHYSNMATVSTQQSSCFTGPLAPARETPSHLVEHIGKPLCPVAIANILEPWWCSHTNISCCLQHPRLTHSEWMEEETCFLSLLKTAGLK